MTTATVQATTISTAQVGGRPLFVGLISIVSAMGGFLFGYETVVIAATIPIVKAQFALSAALEGWFVTSGLLGCVFGVAAASRLCDSLGRKNVMLLSGLLLVLGAVGCAFSAGVFWLVTLRIAGGVGVGLTSIVSPLYISEVAPARVRGRLVSMFQVTITLGIVAAMLVNAQLLRHATLSATAAGSGWWDWLMIREVWRGMFLYQSIPALAFFLCTLLVPESPRWLVLRGRLDDARKVILRLRGAGSTASSEIDDIQSAVSNDRRKGIKLLTPEMRRPLFIGIFLAVFSELSGITVVMYYGPTILEKAGASASASLDGHAIIGIVLAAFTFLAVVIMDRVGRRRVLMTGVAGACIALALTGAGFAAGISSGSVIVALLCSFVAFFAFSIGPVKWIVISEIFPTTVRARAMGVATIMLWLTDMLVNQLFPIVRDSIGVSYMFFGFALLLVVQFIVIAAKLPETKGMSLEAIEALWARPG